MKYLLIDGNNLAIRTAFANTDLTNSQGVPTGIHFGVFNSLINLRNRFGDYQFLIVWDGKSERRIIESIKGVSKGIIPSIYKANRQKDDKPQPLITFIEQAPYLQRGIGQTGIPQIRLMNFEADDVIATYCKMLRSENEIIVVTSDHDYFQLLHENVSLWDGMKMKSITYEGWTKETGLVPKQHIECGALSGDTGDNIFGVPGCGPKTSSKWIKKHGTAEAVIEHLKDKYKKARESHPDLDDISIKDLQSIQTEKKNPKYPDVNSNMSFTGVSLAWEQGRWKSPSKTGIKPDLMALMFSDRVKLAHSLKAMDDEIEGLPEIKGTEPDRERILEYFDYYAIETLKDDVGMLV